MALRKCKECGGAISDKAKKCPHCGCPAEELMLTCPECGHGVSDGDNKCPNCGCPSHMFKSSLSQIKPNVIINKNTNKYSSIEKPNIQEIEQTRQEQNVWPYIGGAIGVILLIIGFIYFNSKAGDTASYNSSSSQTGMDYDYSESNYDDNSPYSNISWIYGVWECTTEYGLTQIEITESEIFYRDQWDSEICSYRIEGNMIKMQSSGYNTTFVMDDENKRIDMGGGHWMHKISNSQSSSQYSSTTDVTYFRDAQSVIGYLSSHKFCNGNICLTFQNMCLYINGTCFTGAVDVLNYNNTQAILEANSPLNGARLRFKVDQTSGTLTDLNSGEVYY